VDRLDDRVRHRREEAIDKVWARDRLRLRATVTVELGPDAGEGEQGLVVIEGEPDHVLFLVTGLGSGAYSAKLLTGTRQRFSGFSQPRQCGDDVFRILVTGGPPNFGGAGIPQRIMTISRSPLSLRTTGAGVVT
jgi:hypothetical protein